MTVQRWTGLVSAHESGGFVAVGDYLELEREIADLKAKLAEAEKRYPKSALETHPMIPNSKCKCEHWQRCPECTPSLSAPNQRVIELYEKGLMKDFKGYHHEPRTTTASP